MSNNHDILKRLGLDHLDVSTPDFLNALNRLQREERERLLKTPPSNEPEFDSSDVDLSFFQFDPLPPV